jgi:hypothetical protein
MVGERLGAGIAPGSGANVGSLRRDKTLLRIVSIVDVGIDGCWSRSHLGCRGSDSYDNKGDP